MKESNLYQVNAFTYKGEGGNPAGVMLNADDLSEQEMQLIAHQLGFSETAFVLQDLECDFQVRFFTPNEEVDFCGHATLATFSLMFQLKRINSGKYIERTKAGDIKVEVANDGMITMTQTLPKFLGELEPELITDSLNIPIDWLDVTTPIEIVSTGLADIIVPIKPGYVDKIKPNFEKIKQVSLNHQAIGYHLFELISEGEFTANCRNFAPLVDINEESATGSASGALASYLKKYKRVEQDDMRFLQGKSMENSGDINVSIKLENDRFKQVKVSGSASQFLPITSR